MLILTYLLNLADLAFTMYWVNQYGIGIEGNPWGVWILQAPYRVFLFKIVVPAACLTALYLFTQASA